MGKKTAEELLEFIRQSPSQYHAVANFEEMLQKEGFRELREEDCWELAPGNSYYVMRGATTMIAFQVPKGDWNGFQIAASHSDCPSFKIKENAEIEVENHYTCLNVEKYGGMLYAPWFDRPLSVAGRICVWDHGKMVSKLIDIPRDLVLIPNVAIHMNRKANDGYAYQPQIDLRPLFGDETAKKGFLDLIAREAGISKEEILGTDLFLYDRTPGSIWGASEEFISSRALDDLQCAYSTMRGFLESENKRRISMCCVFDHEEVGSSTRQGADSTVLSDVLERIAGCLGKTGEDYLTTLANSFLLSADNAHGVHPNHPEMADPTNRPYPNHGVVIKHNANQKYTTNGISAGIVKKICERADVPVQSYANRSDIPGGSTLGNISNRHISLLGADIGLAQLAMHSPYETGGSRDTGYLVKACKSYFSASITAEGRESYSVCFE